MIARIDTVKPYIQSLYNIDLRGFAHKKNTSVLIKGTQNAHFKLPVYFVYRSQTRLKQFTIIVVGSRF